MNDFQTIRIGIDQSFTSTGLCIKFPDGLIAAKAHQTKPTESVHHKVERAREIVNFIMKDVLEACNNYPMAEPEVRIEGLSMGKNTTSSRDLAGLQFMIIDALKDVEINDITIVPPKSLKKLATGNGNASKDEMVDAIKEPVEGLYDDLVKMAKNKGRYDIADAFWLAHVELEGT